MSEICDIEFSKTPNLKNELFNREYLSPQINTARKFLMRKVLEFEADPLLGFEELKFPPEKSIYLSLLKNTGIHAIENGIHYYTAPADKSFMPLWDECISFLN